MPQLDRRDFLRLVGASAGAAAAAGCADPIEKLVPYVVQPEEITPGIAVHYSSTCTECSAACGLHVTTREARPIKLEGNPDHPINRGRLCTRGQAAIARTFLPDRFEGPMSRSGDSLERISWEAGRAQLVSRLEAAAGKTWVLGGAVGPTLSGLIDGWVAGVGAAGRIVYEPFAYEALRSATQVVFGVSAIPLFDLSSADLVIDFGSDFLDGWLSQVENMRQFAEAQDINKHKDGGARLVSIAPRMSLTGSNSDQWIPAVPGSEGLIALALAKELYDKGARVKGADAAVARVLAAVDTGDVEKRAGLEPGVLEGLVKQLLAAKSAVALPPGVAATSQRAVATTAAVLLLNSLMGSIGKAVTIPQSQSSPAPASMKQLDALIAKMQAGQVDVLIIHDSNPVYSMPADSGFQEALSKVGLVVSTASAMDETAAVAHLVLPDHTPLESWGDAAPRPGVHSVVQPTIRPLHDTQALGDTLLETARALGGAAAAGLPSGNFHAAVKAAFSGDFRAVLAKGGEFSSVAPHEVAVSSAIEKLDFREPQIVGQGDFSLVAYPHSFIGDGSGAALPWLQETPDPVTKLSWSSWVEMSHETAKKLGVVFGDVVSVETGAGAGKIELSAFPRGGIRHDVMAVAIGQGHTQSHYGSLEGTGQAGVARGASVISVLPNAKDEAGGRVWLSTRAKVSRTGRFQRLALSQWTDNQRGRGLAPEVSLLALAGHGDDHEDAHSEFALPFDTANDAHPDSLYKWAMAIDNDRCTGCSACVVACSIENNVPVVGEEQAIRHREMTWIRLDRFVGDGDTEDGQARRLGPYREELGKVDVRHSAMLCQQCGAAPCESVCPVLATYHSTDGLNGMIYNRCVGTRYCANNCTYDVRRFNYWDYSMENWPGLLPLMLNPEVTVRGQGVMEKCTFCVQRIASARQTAKDENRPIADGEVVTACQQSCPADAISFGNARDKASEVVKRASDDARSYWSLHSLNTRPGITYLAQVKRADDERSHG